MAKAKTETKKGNGAAYNKRSGAPEGFKTLTSDRSAPWVKVDEGVELTGYLLGRFEIRSKRTGRMQGYYQLKLTSDSVTVSSQGEEVEASKGDIVNLNETKATETFRALAESDGKFEIYIKVKGKIELDNGQSFWEIETAAKTLKAPTGKKIPTSRAEETPADDDTIPF